MLQYFDFDLSLIKKDTVDFKSVNDSRPFKKNAVLAKYHENWGGWNIFFEEEASPSMITNWVHAKHGKPNSFPTSSVLNGSGCKW